MTRIFKMTGMVSSMMFAATTVYAGGLSSYFVEERLENLKPGRSYSVKEMAGKALSIINTTDNVTVDIAIEAEKPVAHNLVKGYEPIPDLSWIKIKKNYFSGVGPKESAETDIIIKVPPNKKHYGKKYQVYIYSHTAGQASFRIGLMSRILLEVANPEPRPSKITFSIKN